MGACRSPYAHASLTPATAAPARRLGLQAFVRTRATQVACDLDSQTRVLTPREAEKGATQQPRQRASAQRQRGYTLIEVVVAFALLALAMTLLLGTLSGATRQVRWSADAGRATLHAQSLLAQTGVGEVLQPGRREGEFEDGRYRWSLEIAPYTDIAQATQAGFDPAAPQLMRLLLSVQWRDGGPRERLQLQSLRLVAPDATQGVALP